MAEMGPPRIARMQQGAGHLKILHPKVGGGKIPEGGLVAGGTSRGGGGLAGAFGGGGEERENGDPAVSGNFERRPVNTFYGFPIAGGGLSDRGKEQQALNQRLLQYNQQVTSMTAQGATFQEAFRALARSNPEALNDLMGHPTALRSMQNLTQALQGSPDANVGTTAQGQVIKQDAQGNLRAEDIPGFRAAPNTQKLVPVTTDIDPKTGKQTITYSNYDAKTGILTPTLGPHGEQMTGVKAGKAGSQSDMVPSDIAGLPPQVSSDEPKTNFNRLSIENLKTTPQVMAALNRMQTAAAAMGPVKGPLAALSGEYFGLNGTGAQFTADRNLIQSQANKMTGSAYAANTKNFMEGIGTASNATSFIKLQASQMTTALRGEAQSLADQESLEHKGKLAPTLAKQLMDVGIVPTGYQTQKNFDQMPAGSEAEWKRRFQPAALTDVDKQQLLTNAANGKYGSPKDPNNQDPDLKGIRQIYQDYQAQKQAQKMQATASTAAAAAQAPQLSAGGQQPATAQPQPGTEPGAAQPQQPNQGPQGQQQQPQQPTAPNNLQQNGQQGQAENPQGTAQGTPPGAGLAPGAVNPLMPPTTTPGQPAQGMPATNATTPQPPASPLPLKTSQMLTPQGNVPTPATQAPLMATHPAMVKDHYIEAPDDTTQPDGSASAPLPPLNPDTLKTLRAGGVPTEAIEKQ